MLKSLVKPIERAIRVLPFYRGLRYNFWVLRGKKLPPPHPVKQHVLCKYARKYQLKTLVETGTFDGRMVSAMLNVFRNIFSIELSTKFYQRARQRFKNASHVRLIEGDSGQKLQEVMPQLDAPALFWLDGHYSGGETAIGHRGSPILEELDHILADRRQAHVIVIDDARLFNGEEGYPTIEELIEHVQSQREDVRLSLQDDSIRILPPVLNPAA